MARSQRKNKRMGRAGRIVLAAFAALLLFILLLAGIGVVNASVVRVRKAEVILPDLPASFDGTRILYASDIDLCGLNTAAKAGALFDRLQSLEPDVLLLGGDYTAPSLLDVLNRGGEAADIAGKKLSARSDFFHYIGQFHAPLGKYAIAAPEDADRDTLTRQMSEAGVLPLFDDRVALRRGEDALWLVGVCEEIAALNSAGSAFQRDDCVIVTAYGPAVLPVLLTSEASDGGQWSDLTLCGHTHGGQVRLFGRNMLPLNTQEQRYRSGWTIENYLPILVTEGVGCEGLNLRLGTAPEVWLITLRRQ